MKKPESPGVAVRVAGVADAPLLADLGSRLFEQTFGPDNTSENMLLYVASAFSPKIQAAELADADYVAWIAKGPLGVPVGYAMLRRRSTTAGIVGVNPAEVQRIYADQTVHGQGAGAKLMEACVGQARAWRCDVIWLAVWEKNPRAIAFYEKTGFRQVGVKGFQLGNDLQRDIVMARPLSS